MLLWLFVGIFFFYSNRPGWIGNYGTLLFRGFLQCQWQEDAVEVHGRDQPGSFRRIEVDDERQRGGRGGCNPEEREAEHADLCRTGGVSFVHG